MSYDKVAETPNMWYICQKMIVQGYQKLYTGPSVSCLGIFFFSKGEGTEMSQSWEKLTQLFCQMR